MLMKPGHTAWPAALMVTAASGSDPGGPILATRSPAMATSARTGAAPVPS